MERRQSAEVGNRGKMLMGDAIFALLALGLLLFFVAVAVFEWLWNITMPEQFGLKPIRYGSRSAC